MLWGKANVSSHSSSWSLFGPLPHHLEVFVHCLLTSVFFLRRGHTLHVRVEWSVCAWLTDGCRVPGQAQKPKPVQAGRHTGGRCGATINYVVQGPHTAFGSATSAAPLSTCHHHRHQWHPIFTSTQTLQHVLPTATPKLWHVDTHVLSPRRVRRVRGAEACAPPIHRAQCRHRVCHRCVCRRCLLVQHLQGELSYCVTKEGRGRGGVGVEGLPTARARAMQPAEHADALAYFS